MLAEEQVQAASLVEFTELFSSNSQSIVFQVKYDNDFIQLE
jgi:hypothetical protein